MGKKLAPENVRIGQINSLDGVSFVRWVSAYENKRSKAVVRCRAGHEWEVTIDNLVNNGRRCPRCSGKHRLNELERIQQLNSLAGKTFVRWADPLAKMTKRRYAIMECAKGHQWSAIVSNLIHIGNGCPKCAGLYNYSSDERVKHLNSVKGMTFVRWDGEYTGNKSKAVVSCQLGHVWSATVNDLINNGTRCPSCSEHGFNQGKLGTLYALRSADGKMVKIGISNDYEQRHTTLKRTTPFEWDCVELLHGNGEMIATLEKVFHMMTDPVNFEVPFDGYTEWRVWRPEITKWFAQWSDLLNRETK